MSVRFDYTTNELRNLSRSKTESRHLDLMSKMRQLNQGGASAVPETCNKDASSASMIKRIVQDLIDLQNQIMKKSEQENGAVKKQPHQQQQQQQQQLLKTYQGGYLHQYLDDFKRPQHPPTLLTSIGDNESELNNSCFDMESVILNSRVPIEIEGDEIVVNGQRGIWANKVETSSWKGQLPIDDYPINEDLHPEIITKKSNQKLEFVQELAIRYLRPPTPPPPGDVIINQLPSFYSKPAPPIIIRQQPARPQTPEPLVIREAPPTPPPQIGRKVIVISGKKLPPPPRKVIIERLAPLPPKPQAVIVERWLPYSQVKRRVIFNKSTEKDPIVVKPKNVIIQWESPQVNIKREYKYLGVIRANPTEYINRYGDALTKANQLPNYVTEIKNPKDLLLAADLKHTPSPELYGDLYALNYVDLDREGLGEYKNYLERAGIRKQPNQNGFVKSASAAVLPQKTSKMPVSAKKITKTDKNDDKNTFNYDTGSVRSLKTTKKPITPLSERPTSHDSSSSFDSITFSLIEEIFHYIDGNQSGRITVQDAEKIFLRINSRLGRQYGEDDVKTFFATLDKNMDGSLDLDEFKNAFLNLAN